MPCGSTGEAATLSVDEYERVVKIVVKKANKKVFEKDKFLYARIDIKNSANDFMKKWLRENKRKIAEMQITNIEIY